MGKKVLLIGGCGSMGSYLTPKLLETGWAVDVATNVPGCLTAPGLRYLLTDAKAVGNLKSLLAAHYDAVIDFLDYSHVDYLDRYELFLKTSGQYFYLSSYRVYSNRDAVTRETSPLQKDVSEDEAFRTSGDYAIYKAQNEETLRASGFRNWTIVRPSIVFSRTSLPLVSFGAWGIWNRAMDGKPTLMPDAAVDVHATCTWSEDIAKLFAGLLGKDECLGETYTLATVESLTWGEWAKLYRELIGLETWTIPLEEYEKIRAFTVSGWRQLHYDRLFDRRMDNAKVLKAAGLTQADLTPVRDALAREFAQLDRNFRFPKGLDYVRNMDLYLAANGPVIRKF